MRWDDADWAPWRPDEVTERLGGVDVAWCVAAGWALDLFARRERREHDDLEISVPQDRFEEVATALGELEWFTAGDEEVVAVADRPERLDEVHQTWGLDTTSNCWRIDVFREPSNGESWICRRDPRIRLPYDELIERTAAGIPYVRPEVALLFKAKATRPKDEQDFDDVLPLLRRERRALLRDWIALVHPGHAWLARLA